MDTTVVCVVEILVAQCLLLRMAGIDICCVDISNQLQYLIHKTKTKYVSKMFRSTLIGVASYILGYCTHPQYAVYARVTAVKNWIKWNTRGTEDSNCH